ncbi:hypothetical protein MVES1_003220 [Malassezia vespertilionis]|nr:uncharacterized protein MVES1_003220 [Malassezia vespertilionis]WFD07853.1 hypothetical protein MVES1_003220 [Malassezia vespertilionis]
MRINLGTVAERMRELRLNARTTRLPEKFMRKFVERIERIAMGRDAQYSMPLFRQTIGAFYGTLVEATTLRKLKESRNMDELVQLFLSSAQTSLRKRISDEKAWKEECHAETGLFVGVVRESLRSFGAVPRELSERLNEYARVESLSELGEAPTKRLSQEISPAAAASWPVMNAVGTLFSMDVAQLVMDIESIQRESTLAAGLSDLKRCVFCIHTNRSWPGAQGDFSSEDTYKKWRSNELSSLSALMVEICKADPSLLSTPSGDANANRPRKSLDAAFLETVRPDFMQPPEGIDEDGAFTYIPPDPLAAYHCIFARCMDLDLERIRQKDKDEEVLLTILSPLHEQLLQLVAVRWRIPRIYHITTNLRLLKVKFDCGEIPFECMHEALEKALQFCSADALLLRVQDQKRLLRCLDSLADSCMRNIYTVYKDMDAADMTELAPNLELITTTRSLISVIAPDRPHTGAVDAEMSELHEAVRISAIQSYTEKTTELFATEPLYLVQTMTLSLRWIQQKVQALDAKFPPALLSISPTYHIVQKLVPLYLDDLESIRDAALQQAIMMGDTAIYDALDLFQCVRDLMAMYEATEPLVPLRFDLCRWFAPYVQQWLALAEQRAQEWVLNAVRADTFAPIEGAVHSTSINDLFDALQQPLNFFLALKWPNRYGNACFLTEIAKCVSRLIELYCHTVESLFMAEMLPAKDAAAVPLSGFAAFLDSQRANEYLGALPPKQAAWLAKAKQSIAPERVVKPFFFEPQSCVKLNNIEAARTLLDVLYRRMDADAQAAILQHERADDSAIAAHGAPQHLFTVKIVRAELQSKEELRGYVENVSLDTFVTLSDDRGERLAKTRTILSTASPRWDEVLDIPVPEALWISATVWHREAEMPRILGRASLHLDPDNFAEQTVQEAWLDLDSGAGKLMVRINKEVIVDDILFHFGLAFRLLKRAEVDMVRVLVDHMSMFMRQYLSRSVLRSMVRARRVDLDRALDNVKALYTSAVAQTSFTIPPVDKSRAKMLSDQEIEEAIAPLLDYFEESLGTLKSSLSEDEAQFVLTCIWKEVLVTLEGLLVPPLADSPSDMKQLSEKEVDIVFKWLSFLRNYFNAYDPASGVAHGVPLDVLQGPKYRELLSYLLLHDQSTDQLMIECVRSFQAHLATDALAHRRTRRAKSVLDQRSLGTIKKHKRAKAYDDASSQADMAMKILRMRPGTGDFLAQQLVSMKTLKLGKDTARSAIPSLRRSSQRLSMLAASRKRDKAA